LKFIVFCPDANTGGPFALLQLAKAINDLGHNCEILFYNIAKIKSKKTNLHFFQNSTVNGSFSVKYKRKPRIKLPNLEYKICDNLNVNDIIIFPEVALDHSTNFLSLGFKKRVFWWLSWDNAPLGNLTKFNNIVNLNNSTHIFQSKYAQIEANRLGFTGQMVSDYTIFNKNMNEDKPIKTNDICFLEGKAPGTEKLIQDLNEKFSIISIKKMSQLEVINTLKKSKFFIDFGSHPGKDRIPREAALHYCIPLVHNVGAAKYSEDVPLPKSLKLDTTTILDSKKLILKLNELSSKIEVTLKNIELYINGVKNERDIFYQEVEDFLLTTYNEEL